MHSSLDNTGMFEAMTSEKSLNNPLKQLEVEITESRRRYITIEVTDDISDKICEWSMKYNPTALEEQAAINAVKSAKVVSEQIMHDTYEIGYVEFVQIDSDAPRLGCSQEHCLAWVATADRLPGKIGDQIDVLMWSPHWATWLKGTVIRWGTGPEWAIYDQLEDRYYDWEEAPEFWMVPSLPTFSPNTTNL